MRQIKAPIAGKTQSNRFSQSIRFAHGLGLGPAHGASFSKAIAKIGNAELVHFNKQMLIHELIRGSLYYLFGGKQACPGTEYAQKYTEQDIENHFGYRITCGKLQAIYSKGGKGRERTQKPDQQSDSDLLADLKTGH